MKKRRTVCCVGAIIYLIFGFLMVPPELIAGEIIIIANPDVPTNVLYKKDIKKIFLGKMGKWQNNDKIIPVVLKDESMHKLFLKEYIKRTPSQFKMVWKRAMFTGKGKPPKKFKTEKDMIEYIAKTKGAIGYVTSGTSIDKVKSITSN